ncbi:hypothetical protein [Nocardia sp. NPDC056000]|uniref:hypothetical protein n=1 Tax=Nocardia sp. NPDC056000 TaxID=3345674 RepID=UPI0035DBCF6E
MATTLKALLQDRHLQSHTDFTAEYKKYARQLDPKLADHPPGKAQFYKWLNGDIQAVPRGNHCRVLEAMFSGWTVEMLFQEAADRPVAAGRPGSHPPEAASGFEAFLGSEMVTHGATLVYPTFELARASTQALSDAGVPRQHIFGKPNSVFPAKHRIDVPMALAENDVRGLMYVFSVLQRYTSIDVEIQSDSDVVAQCNRPFISFGLSSNDCTHMYLEDDTNRLFTIQDDPESGAYLEFLQLSDGTRYSSTDDTNIGIIARVRPNPELHPDRNWIYCAGLGPRGTTGASWYLANYWNVLHDKAGANDFVAVVKVRSYSDQTTHLEHILVAEPEE